MPGQAATPATVRVNVYEEDVVDSSFQNAIFARKQMSYYDRHNPHMRWLNAHNMWASNWDPTTSLMYIV